MLTHEVSLAVEIANLFSTMFAFRGGAHIGQAGIMIDLVDLKGLNEITVSSDAAVVSLGPGNR